LGGGTLCSKADNQPEFVNCAISVSTALTPQALLGRAQVVEAAFGRDRAKETVHA